MRGFLFLLSLIVSGAAGAQLCETGLDAFETHVYPKMKKDCASCHGGGDLKAPPFALDDVALSYQRVLSYMNFNDIENSLFVIRAGNGHCGEDSCEFESGEEMLEAGESWWSKGENQCFRNGKFFSKEIRIPKKLPTKGNGFATLTFDLGAIQSQWDGVLFQIEIQDYFEKSVDNEGAYLIRSPRLLNGTSALQLKDVKILLNGKYDPLYNAFTDIDKSISFFKVKGEEVFSASPVLSSQSLILLKDSLSKAKLSVSFVELSDSQDEGCFQSSRFSRVQALLESNTCASCHSGQQGALGQMAADFSGKTGLSCQVASQLVHKEFVGLSPLLSYPIKERFGHSRVEERFGADLVKAVNFWLKKGE